MNNSLTALTPMLTVTRGQVVECIHFGAVAVVDARGNLLAFCGNAEMTAFLRSSAKPFQCLPFVERGGPQAFNLSERELALLCASHAGSEMHVQTVAAIQSKAGIDEANLQCGTHLPEDVEAFKAIVCGSRPLTPNRHNCSGKHTGMLAHARLRGLPLETYLDLSHPIQQDILATLCEMCSINIQEVKIGIDGCSAPNFAIPLYNAALGYARLADPASLPVERARACQQVTAAMSRYPEMVAGHGKFDTRLMEVGGGRIISKGGADGYQAGALLPGALGPDSPGVGIVLKIADGDTALRNSDLSAYQRARPAVMLEILRQLGALDESQLAELAEFGPVRPVLNNRGLIVGERRPVFELQR